MIAFIIEILDEERGPRDENHVDKRGRRWMSEEKYELKYVQKYVNSLYSDNESKVIVNYEKSISRGKNNRTHLYSILRIGSICGI
jgi:hypothetical protein